MSRGGNVVEERISFRWGIPELDHGNVIIPEPIYRFHGELGVTGNHFVLIVQLSAFRYESKTGKASPSFQTLAQRMGISRRQVMRVVKKLEDDGWLTIVRRGTETNEYNFQPFAKACWDLYLQSIRAASDESDTSASDESDTTLVTDMSPEEQEYKNKNSKNKNNILPSSLNRQADEVIDYLNQKTHSRFRHSEASRKYIRARIQEGSSAGDCKLIIDHKAAQWMGTEFEQYLNPETLFRPTKFERNLNAAIKWEEAGRPDLRNDPKSKLMADLDAAREFANG